MGEHALQKSLQLKHLPKHQKLAKPTCPEPTLMPIAHAMPTGNFLRMPLSALKSHVPLHSGRDSLETLEHALKSHVPPTSRERMETLEHALQNPLQLKHLPKHQKLAKPTCPEPALVPIAHAMPTGNLKL